MRNGLFSISMIGYKDQKIRYNNIKLGQGNITIHVCYELDIITVATPVRVEPTKPCLHVVMSGQEKLWQN